MMCPNCNSENVQSVAMAYGESGSVVYDKHNRQVGTQRTATGMMLQPPKPRAMWWRWVITVYFGFDTIYALIASVMHPAAIVALVIVAVLTFVSYRYLVKPAKAYNSSTHLSNMQQWQQTWLCKACGNMFAPHDM